MPEEQNYYEEMGISLDATESQIREAYKKLAKKYHPDLNPDMPRWAATQMKKLNMMYNTLSDPLRRQDYDKKIGKTIDKTSPSSHPHDYESQNPPPSPPPWRMMWWGGFGGLSARTLRTTAIGMLVSGIVAFLILSFLSAKPSKIEQSTINNKKPESTAPSSLLHEEDAPSKAEVHYKKGIEYVENDMFPEAIAEFKKAIAINPEHFRTHAYLGFAYGVVGRLDEAIHEYEKAINIKPDYADAYYGLSAIYKKKGMHERAERELEIYKWLTEGDTE